MRTIKLLTLVLALLLVFAGCGTNNSSTDTGAEKTTLAVSSTTNAQKSDASDLSKVTLRVGQTGWGNWEAGLKAAGLSDTPYKIEYSVFQGGNLCLEAMAANHIDFTGTSEIPPIFASLTSNGGNFKIIAINNSNTLLQEVVVPKDSPIKSIADLKGKKVAYVNSTTSNYFLLKMLEKAGLKWEDITPVQLTTADGAAALLGGKVDALASYGNAIISTKQNGATTLESAKDILSGNFPYEATPEAIADPGKHAAIADFLNRLNQFNDWARQNPEQWAKITAENTKQPVEQALKTYQDGEAMRPTKVIPVSKEAIASQQDIADVFLSVGLLEEKVNVEPLWNDGFSDEIK